MKNIDTKRVVLGAIVSPVIVGFGLLSLAWKLFVYCTNSIDRAVDRVFTDWIGIEHERY